MTPPTFTTEEVFIELARAKEAGIAIQFENTNPHWWIGVNEEGTFYHIYNCCDLCGDEIDHYDTMEKLKEYHSHDIQSQWYLCK